jgi:hypothetical protein
VCDKQARSMFTAIEPRASFDCCPFVRAAPRQVPMVLDYPASQAFLLSSTFRSFLSETPAGATLS